MFVFNCFVLQLIYITLCFIQLPVASAQYPGGEYLSQKAKSCSFTDDATGYQASWHTNCTGKVNFVINFRNFPRSDPIMGMNGFGGASDNYWTGIGFKLLLIKSWEMALVENLNGYVAVTSARLNPGQPPQREIGGGILLNPQGQFFSGELEATFAIDETLLTGCKEWTFFTKPARVGTPYGGQPYTRIVCNVAETCSRNYCGTPIYDPYSSVGILDGQPQSSILNGGMGDDYVLSDRLYGGGTGYSPQNMYNSPQSSYYGGNSLGGYNPSMGYGNSYDYGTYQRANAHGLNYIPNPNYRFYSPGTYQGLQQQAYGSYQYPQYQQQSVYNPQYGQSVHNPQYGYAGYGGSYSGQAGSYLIAKRRRRVLRQANFGTGTTFTSASANYGSLNGTAYEGQDRQFVREPLNTGNYPPGYVNPQYQYDPSAANRKEYYDPQTNTFYYTGMYYPYRTEVGNDNLFEDYKSRDARLDEGQAGRAQFGSPTPNAFNSPGSAGRAQFSSPTPNAFNSPGSATYRDPPAVNGAIPQRFLDPCDGGVDPYWCTEYIRQMTNGQQGTNQRQQNPQVRRQQNPQSICPALVESLKNSDHKCCNALKNLGCYNV